MKRDEFWVRPNGGDARLTTVTDAAIIKGMLKRGDNQHDIAAYFGVDSGRISETNTGKRYQGVAPAARHVLPPPGSPLEHARSATIQITGVAEKFWACMQRTEQKVDQLQHQLAAFGRRIGVIEEPRTPRITRRKPLEG